MPARNSYLPSYLVFKKKSGGDKFDHILRQFSFHDQLIDSPGLIASLCNDCCKEKLTDDH